MVKTYMIAAMEHLGLVQTAAMKHVLVFLGVCECFATGVNDHCVGYESERICKQMNLQE